MEFLCVRIQNIGLTNGFILCGRFCGLILSRLLGAVGSNRCKHVCVPISGNCKLNRFSIGHARDIALHIGSERAYGHPTDEVLSRLRSEDGDVYDVIAGNFFICSCKGCDFSSLSVDEQKKYQKMYERPELFFCTDAGLAVAVVDERENKRHR